MKARQELLRFREFISFLRYGDRCCFLFHICNNNNNNNNVECSRGHPSNPDMHTILPRHDILEVNSYLLSGLINSPIDLSFIGAVPQSVVHSP